MNKRPNRLAQEKSPYLLQHAHNPVDWYPWGEEAFAKAKKEDKPVFLSIGYSTCHWCHVMEHESFEDEETARILNEHFVSIKVDREERPDIDNIYMTVVTALTGTGGWPLSAFLTPEKKPFYGGTYFPPVAKWGSPGFKELLVNIRQTWETRRQEIIESSRSITEALQKRTAAAAKEKGELTPEVLDRGYQELSRHYDHRYGGFGQAPKFPMGHSLSFLLRCWKRTGTARALEIVENTLQKMARGGIYDHLGGGFHRYATDQEWQVPHFEKMLYDQAILVRAYIEAYQATKNEDYASVARETLDYVLRDMQSKEGGFYSAEDADSLDPQGGKEKAEGAFYLWTQEEIKKNLTEEEAKIFNHCFGIENSGNAKFDPHGEFAGKNILFVAHDVEETAKVLGLPAEKIKQVLCQVKEKLYRLRQARPRPHLDDKVLTDWNGLMISAAALAGRALDEKKYVDAAERSAGFILKNMVGKEGRLLHRYRDGDAAIAGTLEDYAFFIYGLIDLYESTFDTRYLKEAKRLAKDMLQLFADKKEGGFFFTAQDGEELLFRHKEIYDGALPSANSIALLDLLRLGRMADEQGFIEKADASLRFFAPQIQERPSAYVQSLTAFDFALGPSFEIVLAEGRQNGSAAGMLNVIHRSFLPNRVLLWRPLRGAEELFTLAAFTREQGPLHDQTAAYVCQNHVCKRPVVTVEELAGLLK